MPAPSLTLPGLQTCVFVVDPLYDFMKEGGEFSQCYGPEDTEPVRKIHYLLRNLAHEWRSKVRIILCKSHYEHDQFGVPKLENLCTTEEGRSCKFEKEFFFEDNVIKKRDTSILTAGKKAIDFLQNDENVVLTGVTTTHCIRKSVEDIRKRMGNMRIIIPRNAVAARKTQSSLQESLFEEWKKDTKITIVDSWENIGFA